MNEDYLDPKYSEGMSKTADASISLDFLLSIKNGIRNYSFAITEASTPELRKVLHKQMEQAIDLYGEAVDLMMSKGWLYPHDLGKQIELDLKAAEVAAGIGEMILFPNDTDRLGMFATPNQ